MNNKPLVIIITVSLLIKLALFCYAAINVPLVKFMPDTATYIEPGINLMEKGIFATFDDKGNVEYETNRTPGYPIFIALCRNALKLSFDYIIILQILLITLAGYIVYKSACGLDKNIALVAAFIFLFDPPTTIASLTLLTEALYALFMSIFIFFFLKYLKENRIGMLILSVLAAVIATYIRPVSYYLGICLAGGVMYAFYRKNMRKAIAHALILLIAFYALLAPWHYRNYIRTGNADFTAIDNRDLNHMGLTHKYARYKKSKNITMRPFLYYTDNTAESLIQFFTLPGTLKRFRSKFIGAAYKTFAYPWAIFCLIGLFFAGYGQLPYRFLLFTVLYFVLVSIVVVGLCVGSRFRVPVMPLLSILSASGWMRIVSKLKNK